jgi:hypothetical protein
VWKKERELVVNEKRIREWERKLIKANRVTMLKAVTPVLI